MVILKTPVHPYLLPLPPDYRDKTKGGREEGRTPSVMKTLEDLTPSG